MELNKTYCIDNIEGCKNLSDNYIDLIVTSPPYGNLRNYDGGSWNCNELSLQLFRILKMGGVCVWIVGDTTYQGDKTGEPFKQVFIFKNSGFLLYDTMIYKKKGVTFPSEIRYQQCFEYMFIFSKGKPKTINLIKDKKNVWFKDSRNHKTSRMKDGSLKRIELKKSVPKYSIRSNVWEYDTGCMKTTKDKTAYEHPAMFPELLAKDHIVSWSNEKDIILDPFMGSGTTGKMALLLNRNFIGFEISKRFCNLSNKRTETYKNIQKNKLFKGI